MASVLIVGAGVAGLSCGVALAEAGHRVRIRARECSPSTTSDVAAAVWYPLRGERDERVDRWLAASLERFLSLSSDPSTGIVRRGGIELFRSPTDDAWWRDVLPGFRRARADELPAGFADGFVSEGLPVIEMGVYLPWLAARFEGFGGTIERRAVGSLEEALDEADVVVNCSGLGARDLCGDDAVYPVRGQVVRVAQFGLERFMLDEQNPAGIAYIWPRARDIVLGGTRQEGDWALEPRSEDERGIIERCAALEPRVAEAPVVSRAVGLRPARARVRLEAEGRIIHDYGHGGSGVTLSWGCAADVAQRVG